MPLYILKIGGSAVTEKEKNKLEVKIKVIKRIAKEIAIARKRKKFLLIIVHGGGPFGHLLIKKYGIENGIRIKRHIDGLIKTRQALADLNQAVVNTLICTGIRAISIPPSVCIIQRNKKVKEFCDSYITIIKSLFSLSSEIVPVLYGGLIFDETQGASVVSGDILVPLLAKRLKAKRLLLGTDVKGIFTANPKKQKDAKLVRNINLKNFKEVLKFVGESNAIDVTQGMRGKLMSLKEFKAKNALVFDLTKKKNLYNVLIGKDIAGSRICL